jgi:hypothetical protein
MWIRASILGFLLLAVLGGAGEGAGYTQVGQSLQAYQQNYRALDRDGDLNSLDRLILTVMLAHSKPHQPAR